MTDYNFVLADAGRTRQWPLLAGPGALFPYRLLQGWGDNGVPWVGRTVDRFGFATSLWPNWMFNELLRAVDPAKSEAHLAAAMGSADDVRNRFRALRAVLRFGSSALRIVWSVHAAVLAQRSSRVRLSDQALARAVWGNYPDCRPRGWRADLRTVLVSLTHLHLIDQWSADDFPNCGEETAVLFAAVERRRSSCPAGCPDIGHRHRHIEVDIGPVFLGVLEQFSRPDPESPGVRQYEFPEGRSPKLKKHSRAALTQPTLRSVGKSGQLVSVFLPAYLGEPARVSTFSASQIRLLEALVRETTRALPARNAPSQAQVFSGALVPSFSRQRPVPCPMLRPDQQYVGFNGNGCRKGQGYKVTSEHGWLSRAGFEISDPVGFLADLDRLADRLKLTVVGIDQRNTFHSLADLRAFAGIAPGRQVLDQLHVRVYAGADYVAHWTSVFGGSNCPLATAASAVLPTAALQAEIAAAGLSLRQAAMQAGVDASFLAKILKGIKPPPAGFCEKVLAALKSSNDFTLPREPVVVGPACPHLDLTAPIAKQAIALRQAGFNVFPQVPGKKNPYVRWSPYHDELPPIERVEEWFRKFSAAGIAVAPGPTSNLFVIDVDGTEARQELERRLGGIPDAPMVRSGSAEPDRFHLLFRHPSFRTWPKETPWHPKLEFRGHKGLVILPPSSHKSGNLYHWVPGKSLAEFPLSPPPPAILAALREILTKKEQPQNRKQTRPVQGQTFTLPNFNCAPSTRKFLEGAYADGPKWNDQLFKAACDLKAKGHDLETAEPILLAGARPWNDDEADAATRTIRSAFAGDRQPSRT